MTDIMLTTHGSAKHFFMSPVKLHILQIGGIVVTLTLRYLILKFLIIEINIPVYI